MTISQAPSAWKTPAWLVPTATIKSTSSARRRRIVTAALAIGALSVLPIACFTLMPSSTFAALGTFIPSLSGPLPPQHDLFGIPGFGSDVEIAFMDIYFNETTTRDADSIPIAQNLAGADMESAFTTFQLDNPNLTNGSSSSNSTPSPDEYILSQRKQGAATRTVTAQIAPRHNGRVDASHITFGLATSLDRISGTVRNVQHWAAGTDARFIIVLIPRKDGSAGDDNDINNNGPSSIDEAEALFAAAGVPHVTFIPQQQDDPKNAWENAYMSLITHFHASLTPKGGKKTTRWVSWIDDDTFFPSLPALTSTLSTRFGDADRQPYYVGQMSERYEYVRDGGIVAFGGAGVFLSVPLLEQLALHADACFRHERHDTFTGGDFRLADCVHRWTTTKLSPLEGLHQLDFGGDASGFYEAERAQPLSVHHWKSWHAFDMPEIARVGEVCGDACILQHFRLGGRGQWAMTNGFSIVRYSTGYRRVDSIAAARERDVDTQGRTEEIEVPGAMEKTWDTTRRDAKDMWEYSLEPLMDKDSGKRQYLLEKLERDAEGNMVVDYVHREEGVGRGLIRVRLMAITPA
ncbi:hypothetical protein Micbo1qcDRAFT_236434 [Microdochium bolleyi]|uniref:Glycosyltransferase family 31 protein n=1 Tax=Microdochium bolleyi TaxID=196109 RepID=A0A136IQS5_9PEZI|nr:hypothetical protein Micbo1qcDRAFT_236434 [Microdochium bolleyi]